MLKSGTGVFLMVAWMTGFVSAAVFNPIDVSGWDADIVVGTTESALTGTSEAMDGGDANGGATVYYEQGFNPTNATSGLKGGLMQSTTTSDLWFQLQSFTSDNAIYKGGTLTLTTAAAYDRIALIGATGNGTGNLTVTFKYTTGGDSVFYPSGGIEQDWFNGSEIAYTANGRVSTVNGEFTFVDSENPRLYESIFDIDQTRLLQSVVITDNNAASTDPRPVVMAISGEAIPEPASIAMLSVVSALGFFIRRRFFD
jgi:hypothetical protein